MRKHTRRAEGPKSAASKFPSPEREKTSTERVANQHTPGTAAGLPSHDTGLYAKPFASDTTLATLIDSSRSTVWRYVRTGILPPPLKIGGLTRFDVAHAMACIRAGRIVPWPRSEE